jgi:hypothetical protein
MKINNSVSPKGIKEIDILPIDTANPNGMKYIENEFIKINDQKVVLGSTNGGVEIIIILTNIKTNVYEKKQLFNASFAPSYRLNLLKADFLYSFIL